MEFDSESAALDVHICVPSINRNWNLHIQPRSGLKHVICFSNLSTPILLNAAKTASLVLMIQVFDDRG